MIYGHGENNNKCKTPSSHTPDDSAVTTEAVTETPVDLTVAVCVAAFRPRFTCCCCVN